jgi:hypothetical protein
MVILSVVLLFLVLRLRLLRQLWRLPLKNGEGYFLAQRVVPGFYSAAGAPLFRRYRASLFVPLLLDTPVAVWLALTERYVALALEQLLAMVVSIIAYNLLVVHFSARAAWLCGDQEERPTTSLQLSMAPRTLRDHTIPAYEAVIVIATLLALAMLAHSYEVSLAPGASHSVVRDFRGGILITAWVLYWQIGFLLLKCVFVRWRMPLPVNRTEDFHRWRTAWLSHKVKVFDAARLFGALSLLVGMTRLAGGRDWPRSVQSIAWIVAALGAVVYVVYVMRAERRLAATERELKPVEMVKEFPRWPVAEGHYIAGGLLYFNRDNPSVMVKSAQGIALNLAHRTTYIWAAYFMGLIALVVWMANLIGR